MSLTAALFLLAQSAVPNAVEQGSGGDSQGGTTLARPAGARVQVQASARVLRAVRIDLPTLNAAQLPEDLSTKNGVQRARDAAGTIWIEFS